MLSAPEIVAALAACNPVYEDCVLCGAVVRGGVCEHTELCPWSMAILFVATYGPGVPSGGSGYDIAYYCDGVRRIAVGHGGGGHSGGPGLTATGGSGGSN